MRERTAQAAHAINRPIRRGGNVRAWIRDSNRHRVSRAKFVGRSEPAPREPLGFFSTRKVSA